MRRIIILCSLLLMLRSAYAVTRNAPSLSLSDVQSTVDSSSRGDVVQLPAGTSVWTGTLQLTNAITLRGMGTNQTWITNAIGDDTLSLIRIASKVQAPIRIRQLSIVTSPGAPARGITCVSVFENNFLFVRALEISDCLFIGCQDRALNLHAFGVVSRCTFIDCYNACWSLGGANGGNNNWAAFSPIAFNSTNYLCVEDCRFVQSASYSGGGGPYIASQGGAAYIVRNCTFDSYSEISIFPFDVHGNNQDNSVRGTIGWQFYNNTLIYHAANGPSLLWDIRGGSGLVYSNSISGASTSASNIRMREEDASLYFQETFDGVTNVFIWNNSRDGSLFIPSVQANESTNVIRLGIEYFTNSPPGYIPLSYPNPLLFEPNPQPPPNFRILGRSAFSGNATVN